MMRPPLISYAAIAFLFSCATSQPFYYDHPTANLSTKWINAVNSSKLEKPIYQAGDIDTLRPILVKALPREPDWPPNSTLIYVCGFYRTGTNSYLFSISIVGIDVQYGPFSYSAPEVVWSANRNNPVGENATVELTNSGALVLKDADGSLVWSTNTGGKGLNLTEMGNLLLFHANHSVIWQSFDHPTDCLLVGQILRTGMNLTAASSPTSWSSGSYSFTTSKRGLVASLLSHPPQAYAVFRLFDPALNEENVYAEFQKGVLVGYPEPVGSPSNISVKLYIASNKTQYIKLEHDGHLRAYEWNFYWKEVADLLDTNHGGCEYPKVCSEYGICTNGQCSCPPSSFRPRNERLLKLGCYEVIPLTCNASDEYTFLDLKNVTYFIFNSGYGYNNFNIMNTDMHSCKEACLKNCSCKAAMFAHGSNSSDGYCYLPTEIFSLMNYEQEPTPYSYTVSLKIHSAEGKTSLLRPVLGSTLGIFLVIVVIGIALFVYRRRKRKAEEAGVPEEDYLDHVPGMPTRFSFEELAAATDDFSNKLGEGGFGSVYEGALSDGTKIAVKRLDGVGHIKKSFLAEVESIGSIHHVNLVRLIGFCAEKFHRLLVYEYMCNGSLEKWIYSGSHERFLDWNKRRKIILDVAKGLAYLHEECRQKILHLDIKPQNILLDELYNAKLADFGLSKLIDRNQSHVVTTMRGTPGYLAPEWLDAIVTEKLDVYSFGVVVLEILTGRNIFDQSRPEEERHLLKFFKSKAEEGQWLDLVDICCRDDECDPAEVEKMMQMSAWCLQSDHEKRPSMSMVIKVMEGDKDVPDDIDCNLLIPRYLSGKTSKTSSSKEATPLLPLLLSGPR